MKKLGIFFMGVKKEIGRIRWPKKKELITYSVATLTYILFFGLFFTATDFILAGLRTLVG